MIQKSTFFIEKPIKQTIPACRKKCIFENQINP